MVGTKASLMRPSILLAAILILVGCGKKNQDFIPEQSTAEQAMRTALEAWKADGAIGQLPNTNPSIFVTDNKRKKQQTLTDYTILGEVTGTAGRTFMVELKLSNPSETLQTRYVIVGIDPLWIFRQEDYELLMHWDHHMPEQRD